MFGEVCPGCHIRFIKIFRHQKGKEKQPRDLISDSQAESTSGIFLLGHNRLILLSCLPHQQNVAHFCELLHPGGPFCVPSSPGYPRLFSCRCSHLQPLQPVQTEAQTLLLPHFWEDRDTSQEQEKRKPK